MNHLIGVYYFDSRPVPPRDQRWIGDVLVRLDPSGGTLDAAPGLLAGSVHGDATHAGRCVALDGSICVWDGRLDNRQDLMVELGLDDSGQWTDSGLALRVFQAKGIEGLRDLVGDWSLVIWDAASRSIVLASDYAGVRPLYYQCTPDRIMWSSALSDLVRQTGITELDEEFVARFLTQAHAAHRSPYRGIYPVPPGHAVRIANGQVRTRAFWHLPVDQDIRFQEGRDYEQRLRELFREAVAVRLPADSPVCAELSGGLDSSSVVCMASQIGRERKGLNLVTFSYTHQGCLDERYFRAVERARNLSGIHLDLDRIPFVTSRQTGKAAPAWWEPRFAELAVRMSRIGSHVLMTGQFGDFITGNDADDCEPVVECLEKRQWVRAAREAFAWSQSQRVPIYPILWRALRTRYSSWTPSPSAATLSRMSSRYLEVDSLAPDLRRRMRQRDSEERKESACWKSADPSRRSRFRALSQILAARILQAPEALQHISYTHPFAHRPLVEFLLTIPRTVVCGPEEPRRLMRRAFSGLLPGPICSRKSKAGYGGVYRRFLLPLAFEMLSDGRKLRVVEHGFVDRASVTQRLTAFTQGLDSNETQLRQIILLEFWLRNGETPTAVPAESASPPQREFSALSPALP